MIFGSAMAAEASRVLGSMVATEPLDSVLRELKCLQAYGCVPWLLRRSAVKHGRTRDSRRQ